ncbi:LOW QUALITY PROTEIN: uncharacterized protein LOC120264596 [Dioscorea cayenensis subsp. rotundata]|uniref:LOW QUALITY PROTEIN: uncharacterized protein LOC120264596 n=1 Tax=Dioscorea cayennensis subsp. rotundata TaxID=55577 RepID=A0AB40BNQ8_DIOCR|nr:LOW QUALITY PROTEIN: uncharacterized protein LOC120264596 [Dioscorea cayenensis subsp. rotundata]
MAYIPPHKRHSLDSCNRPLSPAPPPSSILPSFSKALSLSNHKSNKDPVMALRSSTHPAPSPAGSPPEILLTLPCALNLLIGFGGKSFLLTGCGVDPQEESPWISIAERIEQDLVAAAMSARVGMESKTERVRFSFLARIGKVFLHGSSVSLKSVRKAAATESDSRNQVYKSFNTSVPIEYMETIQQIVVPKIGLEIDSKKEHYYVKVYDKDRPGSLISCKCTIGNGGELEIRKIELNDVLHLVVDVSCLCKDMDLRLMLLTKKVLKSVNDEEEGGINKLIKSAIVDPNVKGGLRWPLGKECLAERFSVVGVWHTKYELFRGRSMKLRLRHANRYDYKTSAGEVSEEVILKLTGISKLLKEKDMISDSLREMMQEAVKLIWLNFLKF